MGQKRAKSEAKLTERATGNSLSADYISRTGTLTILFSFLQVAIAIVVEGTKALILLLH